MFLGSNQWLSVVFDRIPASTDKYATLCNYKQHLDAGWTGENLLIESDLSSIKATPDMSNIPHTVEIVSLFVEFRATNPDTETFAILWLIDNTDPSNQLEIKLAKFEFKAVVNTMAVWRP